MTTELWIKYKGNLDTTTPDLLTGFQMREGQFVEGEMESEEEEDLMWCIINLGGAKDTTADQDQALNINSNVIIWTIM